MRTFQALEAHPMEYYIEDPTASDIKSGKAELKVLEIDIIKAGKCIGHNEVID